MKTRYGYLFIGAALLAILATVLVTAMPSRAEGESRTREIRVSGEGTVSYKPDIAYVSIGVVTQAPTARDAQRKNNEIAGRIIKALKEKGIAEADISTIDLSLFPERRYDDQKKQEVLIGYRSNHTLRVTVRQIDQTGMVIDTLMDVGGNIIQDISFGLSDNSSARDAALEKAVKDATRKAEVIARAAGVKLTGVTTIIDASASAAPPMTYTRKEMSLASADTPVAAGNIQIQARVEMVFGF